MHVLGLHGKSFLPLVLGFGCNVPAVLGARVIESRSGRLLTILLAPLVPLQRPAHGARLPRPGVLRRGGAARGARPGRVLNLLALAAVGVTLDPYAVPRPAHRLHHGTAALPCAERKDDRRLRLEQHLGVRAQGGKLHPARLRGGLGVELLPHGQLEQSYLARFGRTLAPLGGLMGMDWRMLVALAPVSSPRRMPSPFSVSFMGRAAAAWCERLPPKSRQPLRSPFSPQPCSSSPASPR